MDYFVKNAMKNMSEEEQQGNDTVGQAKMTVIGIGGAGQNMVNWLHEKGIKGAEIIAVNTDMQDLKLKSADKKILIGRDLTNGLGAGGDNSKGAGAARESINEIKESIKDSDMVFICAGMGGGTGTGAAPILAKLAKDMGAIVISVVTMPFSIERARIDKAEFGLQQLRQYVNTAIVIDNNRLVNIAGSLPVKQAFAVANEIISTMIKGIVEIISVPSLVNLDFADVKAIMKGGDVSTVGVGTSNTKNKVEECVDEALKNPLLEVSYEGASGALIHVTGGEDMKLEEVNRIGELITENLHQDATVIWGARIDEEHNKRVTLMTIITGVKSPYVLGEETKEEKVENSHKTSQELGIDTIY